MKKPELNTTHVREYKLCDMENERYHSDDPLKNGTYYYSSSVLKGLKKGKFFETTKTDALAFGTQIHSLIEDMIHIKSCTPVPLHTKVTAKKSDEPVTKHQVFTPANLVKASSIIDSFADYAEQTSLYSNELLTEKSLFFRYDDHHRDIAVPTVLWPIKDFIVRHRLNVKIRPDLLIRKAEGYTIVDWKTCTETTLDDLHWSINRYGYRFSLALYATVLALCGYKVTDMRLVFFVKNEGAKRTIVVNADLTNSASDNNISLSDSLHSFVTGMDKFEQEAEFKEQSIINIQL